MARWRRGVSWCSAAVVVTGLVSIPAGQAAADPGLSAAAQYVINVPGDVLTGSAATGTEAAQLAAAQTYDWDFAESQFSAVSGEFTTTPAAPESVLSTSELATFEADAASFAAPAVEAAGVAKIIGGASLPLLGFSVGATIGATGARLFGFTDDQVCRQRSTAMTIIAGVLDGVDCSGFTNALAKAQRNLDNHKPNYPDTCIPGVGCWTFIHQEVVGPGALYNVFSGPCVHESVLFSVNGGTTDTDLNALTGLWPYGCPKMEFPSDATPAVTDFKFAETGSSNGSPVEVVTDSGANPTRTWQCRVATTTGQSYEQDSTPWTEKDAVVAPILCPGLPAGQTAATLTITEHGGGADQTVLEQPTSGAYRAWQAAYPECANGSCALILNQLGQSCFLEGVGCDGWIDDPDREQDYTCTYGTHTIPLSECFPYGPVFNPTYQATGHAYGNPATGESLSGKDSPTASDRIIDGILSTGRKAGSYFNGLTLSKKAAYAASVAAACVAMGREKDCLRGANILIPGGIDAGQAAAHDADAIGEQGKTPLLTYESSTDKSPELSRKWYAKLCSPDVGQQCDEYPFYTSVEASAAYSSVTPVKKDDNVKEGSIYGVMVLSCGLKSKQSKFLVLPIMSVNTTFFCAASN